MTCASMLLLAQLAPVGLRRACPAVYIWNPKYISKDSIRVLIKSIIGIKSGWTADQIPIKIELAPKFLSRRIQPVKTL